MVPTQFDAVLGRVFVAAAPAAVPATIPAWGPPIVELFGANIPIASMMMSLFGLMMARGVSAAREGKTPGGHYLTGTLIIIVAALVIERQPTPGMAVAWGVGVGASGIVIVDLLKDKIQAGLDVLFGRKKDDA